MASSDQERSRKRQSQAAASFFCLTPARVFAASFLVTGILAGGILLLSRWITSGAYSNVQMENIAATVGSDSEIPAPIPPPATPPSSQAAVTGNEPFVSPESVDVAVETPTDESESPVVDVTVTWPEDHYHFAFDSARRRLAMATRKAVRFLNVDDMTPVRLPSGDNDLSTTGETEDLAFKPSVGGDAFLLIQRQPGALLVIDAETLKVRDTIPIGPIPPQRVAPVSDPKSPLVYVAAHDSCLRVNLQTRAIDKWERRRGLHSYEFDRILVAHDPEHVITRPGSSSTNFTLHKVPLAADEPWEAIRHLDLRTHFGYLTGDGRIFSTGNKLFDSQLMQQRAEAEFVPQAFVPNTPWMICLSNKEMMIGSINDARIVQRVPLPEELTTEATTVPNSGWYSGATSSPLQWPVRVFADWNRSRAVVATREYGAAISFDKSALPEEPVLMTSGPLLRSGVVGEPVRFEIETPGLKPTMKLLEQPDGMTLKGGFVEWTPNVDVGDYDVRVELQQGTAKTIATYTIHVSNPKLNVPFYALGCVPLPDGQRAVTWGGDFLPDNIGRQPREPVTESRLAIVDLNTHEVIRQTVVPADVWYAAATSQGIFVTVPGTDVRASYRVLRFDVKTLELRPGAATVSEQWICTLGERYLLSKEILETKTMQPADHALLTSGQSEVRAFGFPRMERTIGVALGNVLWQHDMQKPVALLSRGDILMPSLSQRNANRVKQQAGGYHLQLPMTRENAFGSSRDRGKLLSPDIPAYFEFDSSKGTVTYCGLNAADKPQTIKLVATTSEFRTRPARVTRAYYGESTLTTTADHLLINFNGQTWSLPKERFGGLNEPFRFIPHQSTFELDLKRPTQVSYSAPGAVEYELTCLTLDDEDPLTLSSLDGKFRIDIAAHVPELAKRLALMAGIGQRPDAVGAYRQRVGPAFRELAGKPPRGIPFALSFLVTAKDKDGREAVFQHCYVADMPTQTVMRVANEK